MCDVAVLSVVVSRVVVVVMVVAVVLMSVSHLVGGWPGLAKVDVCSWCFWLA